MSRPGPFSAKPLSVLLSDVFSDAYAKQGFAARELVTRWAEIAGPDIARHAEPLKMQWPRPVDGQPQEPATLVRLDSACAVQGVLAAVWAGRRPGRRWRWRAVHLPTHSQPAAKRPIHPVAGHFQAVRRRRLPLAPIRYWFFHPAAPAGFAPMPALGARRSSDIP